MGNGSRQPAVKPRGFHAKLFLSSRREFGGWIDAPCENGIRHRATRRIAAVKERDWFDRLDDHTERIGIVGQRVVGRRWKRGIDRRTRRIRAGQVAVVTGDAARNLESLLEST